MARPRPQGGEAWRARSSPLAGKAGGLGRLGVAGWRRRAGGAGADDRVPGGGGAAGGGRGSKAARASWPFSRQKSRRPRSEEGSPPGAGPRASAPTGVGRGGALRVGGWARVREAQAGRPEKQQLQPQPQTPGEESCAEKD